MNLKKILKTFLQFSVTVLLLWWIFHDPIKRAQMLEALCKADIRWLPPAFLCFGVVLVLSSFRWKLLMQVQGVDLLWSHVWQIVMIGMFYNLFLPGGTGGDIVKAFYAAREAPQSKSAVLLSVVVDRITGMLALIMISAIIFFYFFHILTSLPMIRAFTIAVIGIFGMVLCVVMIGSIVSRFYLTSRIATQIPCSSTILEIARAFFIYSSHWKAVTQAVLISLFLNLFIFGSAIFVAAAFPGNPGPAAMISVIPVVNTISSLPISLAGIGVREKLLASMLHALYGTPEDLGVLISITGFAIIVLWSLVGGLIGIFYRSRIEKKEITHRIEKDLDHLRLSD